jgi:hypothetical protein
MRCSKQPARATGASRNASQAFPQDLASRFWYRLVQIGAEKVRGSNFCLSRLEPHSSTVRDAKAYGGTSYADKRQNAGHQQRGRAQLEKHRACGR